MLHKSSLACLPWSHGPLVRALPRQNWCYTLSSFIHPDRLGNLVNNTIPWMCLKQLWVFIHQLSWCILWTTFLHFRGAQICCSYGGCFSDNAPYGHLPLPDCPSDIRPVFNLYTRSNRNNAQSMTRTSIPWVITLYHKKDCIKFPYVFESNSSCLKTLHCVCYEFWTLHA